MKTVLSVLILFLSLRNSAQRSAPLADMHLHNENAARKAALAPTICLRLHGNGLGLACVF